MFPPQPSTTLPRKDSQTTLSAACEVQVPKPNEDFSRPTLLPSFPSQEPSQEWKRGPGFWRSFAAICLPLLLSALEGSVTNTALPTISDALDLAQGLCSASRYPVQSSMYASRSSFLPSRQTLHRRSLHTAERIHVQQQSSQRSLDHKSSWISSMRSHSRSNPCG
jgi:hypothetical protein